MKITLKEKPAPGQIAKRLEAASDRILERAKVMAEVKKPGQYTRDGVTITINSIECDEASKRLKVMCSATENGQEIPLDLPFFYTNPPSLVPDGTFRKEVTDDGKEVVVPNFKEDRAEALRQIVYESVLYNKKQ